MLGDGASDLVINEAMVAWITIAIAVITTLQSLFGAWLSRRRDRRQRAADLYAQFYAPDHYRRVVIPVFRLALKWNALPAPRRAEYREAVCLGWLPTEHASELLNAYVSGDPASVDAKQAHFRDTLTTEAFTEHEALTTFLYFWVKADQLIETGLVDPQIFKRLFKGTLGYYDEFFVELREGVKDALGELSEPSWMAATERLIKRLT